MMEKYATLFALLLMLTLALCGQNNSSENGQRIYETEKFKNYWYAGKAEIDSYNLSQSRYGENRDGKAVLIFVTEDFSKKKHVKLDHPESAGSDKVSVLKLNFVKNFVTGIYPYSMMQSVFTPVSRDQYPNTLKTAMSTQEWCGHVFTQMNLKGNNYHVKSYSYFEQEGDEDFSVKKVLLEDEVWNIIRLDHSSLPTGEIEIIPSLFFTRLKHVTLKPLKAAANKTEKKSNVEYTIAYEGRNLTIEFEKEFPHKILRWEEEFMEQGKSRHTTAMLDKTILIDYWTKNKNEFQYLRDSLGLGY